MLLLLSNSATTGFPRLLKYAGQRQIGADQQSGGDADHDDGSSPSRLWRAQARGSLGLRLGREGWGAS